MNQDTCDGSGGCTDNGHQPSGTACGDGSDSECDDPDTCDGSGSCQANLAADGASCGDAGAPCVNQDTCSGGSCQDNGNVPEGSGRNFTVRRGDLKVSVSEQGALKAKNSVKIEPQFQRWSVITKLVPDVP